VDRVGTPAEIGRWLEDIGAQKAER
jgi:hypothetical protein